MKGRACSFCTSCPIFCLQVEAHDDIAGDVEFEVSEKSHNVVYSGMPAARQVRNFTYISFVPQNIFGLLLVTLLFAFSALTLLVGWQDSEASGV